MSDQKTFTDTVYLKRDISTGIYIISNFDATDSKTFIDAGKQDVTFILPNDLDIKDKLIKKLEDKKREILAKNHMEVKDIDEQIAKLLCIESKSE